MKSGSRLYLGTLMKDTWDIIPNTLFIKLNANESFSFMTPNGVMGHALPRETSELREIVSVEIEAKSTMTVIL